MFQDELNRFRERMPSVDYCSLRVVDEQMDVLTVRRDVLQPIESWNSRGGMVTVHHRGGTGYAATPDLSAAGIERALQRAKAWAEQTADLALFDFSSVEMPNSVGRYSTPVVRSWASQGLADKIDMLQRVSKTLSIDDRIVDWHVSLMNTRYSTATVTSTGGEVHQVYDLLAPDLTVIASGAGDTQKRSWGGRGVCKQGGLEVLDALYFESSGPQMAQEAIQLLEAPQCPSGAMDLILMPDQMMLQIHESIGHPLELDRILGDERNYAGTSFVTVDMFGSYQYGSPLLNITFDPTLQNEFAAYGFDDDGQEAKREFIIRQGLLERPLGGTLSRHRAQGMAGVANSRAQSWNRPPIDRMANLNMEPGDKSLNELIQSVENGVLMRTNTSWSIDDSRNKFQFGCELGQRIENGELKEVVKNPNYRGISANFWRNLSGVGDSSTFETLGTPYCGKGEPNQVVRVGHASPAALFSGIQVFGGV